MSAVATIPTIQPARIAVVLSFVSFVLLGAGDGATGVLLPSVQTQYGIGKNVVSLIFLFTSAGFITAAFTSGLLVARLGQRRFLVVGLAALTLAMLGAGSVPPFPLLLVAVLLLGFGYGIVDAGLNAYLTAFSGNTTRLNNLHACYGFGGFLGPVVASALLAFAVSWNVVYLLWFALGGVLVAVFVVRFPADAPLLHDDRSPVSAGSMLTETLRLRVVWLAAIFLLFYVGTEVSAGNWGYSYLTEVRRDVPLFSGWAVSGYWFGVTAGRLVLARLAARLRWSDWRLVQVCLGGVLGGFVVLWAVPALAVSAVALFAAGFALGPMFPTVIALVPSIVPARLVPNAVGFLSSLGNVGSAFFPWFVGTLAGATGLGILMPYLVVMTLVLTGAWVVLRSRAAVRA